MDDVSTFPFQLEEILNQDRERYEVINAAVTGYNAVQERLLLERVGLKFNPDLIIIGFCSNDITGGLRIPSFYGTLVEIAGDPYRFEDFCFLTKMEYYLSRDSYFYQFLVLRFQALARQFSWFKKKMVGSYPKEVVDFFAGNPAPDIKRRIQIFEDQISKIKLMADENKAKVMLISFPTKIHLEREELRAVQAMIKKLCKRLDIYYLDLIPVFLNEKREKIFIANDQDHLSNYGNYLVSLKVKELLRDILGN